jgi:hypothetical protein
MTINNIPSNMNFLGQTTFQFSIIKLPTTNFFVQNAVIPAISLPSVGYGTPLTQIPYEGDHISFDPVPITFAVDEDLKNYIELFNWLSGMGFPEDTNQYAAIAGQRRGFGIFSDAELIVLDAKHIPNVKFTFIDAFPTSLSEINLEYTDDDVEYRTCTATFAYQTFQIESLRTAG